MMKKKDSSLEQEQHEGTRKGKRMEFRTFYTHKNDFFRQIFERYVIRWFCVDKWQSVNIFAKFYSWNGVSKWYLTFE